MKAELEHLNLERLITSVFGENMLTIAAEEPAAGDPATGIID